jgi:FixJ family two-component response regulator
VASSLSDASPHVVVIDDSAEIRVALASLLRSVDLRPIVYSCVADFLEAGRPDGPACLVLDVRLPGRSGIELQHDLAEAKIRIPIVFITGHGDIAMSVMAMKRGAIEFLTKPFRDQDLLDAIQLGIEQDRVRLDGERARREIRGRFDTLTQREREVMAAVLAGRLSKQIAADLGIAEITVKIHRGQMMRKMRAGSLLELARIAGKLKS